MAHQLALLICASPANRENPSIYVPTGLWVPDISEVKDSVLELHTENPLFSNIWYPYSLKDGKYIEGPGSFMAIFSTVGTEKKITILLNKAD